MTPPDEAPPLTAAEVEEIGARAEWVARHATTGFARSSRVLYDREVSQLTGPDVSRLLSTIRTQRAALEELRLVPGALREQAERLKREGSGGWAILEICADRVDAALAGR